MAQNSLVHERIHEDKVLVSEQLTLTQLLDLIEGRVLAIRVHPFFPVSISEELSSRLLNYARFSRYSMGQDVAVQRMGMTLFEAENCPERLDTYFREALETIRLFRDICFPYLLPLDLLRLSLEEIWPQGAHVEQVDGKKMLPGIARMFESNASEGLPPHQDILSRDLPHMDHAQRLLGQVAANIYIKMPPEGGELELWDYRPSDEEFELIRSGRYDFIDRAKLPEPDVLIRPQAGELVLMRSDYVHAVRPSSKGSRVAMACFIGFYGYDMPLSYWA